MFIVLNWSHLLEFIYSIPCSLQGPVVKSIVSLTSSLVVKMLTVLVSTIFNSQVFFAEKNVSTVCKRKATYIFFSAKILAYIYL